MSDWSSADRSVPITFRVVHHSPLEPPKKKEGGPDGWNANDANSTLKLPRQAGTPKLPEEHSHQQAENAEATIYFPCDSRGHSRPA